MEWNSTVLDLPVNSGSERGLLGIALHPDFPSNPGVYLYWTETLSNADTTVLRDRFSGRRHPPHRERRNSQMLPECDPSVLSDGLLTHLPSPFSAHCFMQVGSPTLAGAQLQL